MEIKVCAGCKQEKPVDQFYRKYNNRPRSKCISCFGSHYQRYKTTMRNCNLSRTYKIDLNTYKQMAEGQGNVCWICKEPETRKINGRVCALSVDHDHKTGKVRGLLCAKCNMGLARFKEDYNILLSAAGYLMAAEM